MIQIEMLISHCDIFFICVPFLMWLLKPKGQVHCIQSHNVLASKIQSR